MKQFLLSLTVLALCSCSSSFRREWKEALQQPPGSGVVGAWEGQWKSDSNGHHGRLRCVVSPAKNEQGDHSFHYHATWAGILSGAYRAEHRVVPQKKDATFTGQHDMPSWAGGRYTYGGKIVGDEFSACYQCSMDKGTFQMRRVR
jgi:hypothetical protein